MIVEKKIKTKEVVITKEVDFPTYTVAFSEYEAALLMLVLGSCTSSPLTKFFIRLEAELRDKVDLLKSPYVATVPVSTLTAHLDKLNLSK